MRQEGSVRPAKALLGASLTLVLAAAVATGFAGGCTTGAVAIAQCREIEYARCEASIHCGVVTDVEECKRFYRDQCLHGIAGAAAPTTSEQSACVDAITMAGECAEDDPDGSYADCEAGVGGMGGEGPPSGSTDVCEFLAEPWEQEVCDFLNEPPPEGGSSG